MIEDNHFGKASSFFKNLTLIILKSKVGRPRIVNEVKTPQILTNKQLNSNSQFIYHFFVLHNFQTTGLRNRCN
jgi:hypothetical protein